ncbi:hypothetical protein BaRGS_00021003 [Batillaria attramentaria]|uniref:Uncharacterized protein n=1 Tax=Batillaria attramentaria TaxID=370345 RepID=A0ABD0KKJ2_9CAEN
MARLLFVFVTLSALFLSVNGQFNCSIYNPSFCQGDLAPYCLTNGTTVSGSCDAQRAVCSENAVLDETNNACTTTTTSTEGQSGTATHYAASAILVVASVSLHFLRTWKY